MAEERLLWPGRTCLGSDLGSESDAGAVNLAFTPCYDEMVRPNGGFDLDTA